MRNSVAQVLIHGYLELIKSDNGKEITNNIPNAYLEENWSKHLYESPYHPQIQESIEASNKAVQRSLSAANDNEKDEKLYWDLEINLFNFLHFYHYIREHATTSNIPKYVFK